MVQQAEAMGDMSWKISLNNGRRINFCVDCFYVQLFYAQMIVNLHEMHAAVSTETAKIESRCAKWHHGGSADTPLFD